MPKGSWTAPESGNAPAEVKHILSTVYSAYRDEHPEENEETKSRGAKVAWSAVKKQGWRKNRQGEWTKTRKAKFSDVLDSMIDRLEFASKRKDVSKADREHAKEKYGDVNYADETNKKYPLDSEEHVRAAASYFGMEKNRSKYSAEDQKKIDTKIANAEKKFKIGENKKEFAMIPVKDVTIFRAGTYTYEDKNGKKIKTTFTVEDLDQMVENYSTETPPVAILGHSADYPVESAIPKVGILGKCKRVGEELVATGVQFTEKLVESIKDGFFNDRSIETYKDENGWHLYRLGILGAQPPKVKGMIPLLESIMMSESPKDLMSFQADAMAIEAIETAAEDDTLKNIDQEFATCLSDIENHFAGNDEPDEIRSNCMNALMECYGNVCEEINEHFIFRGKLEQLEPEEKQEMMERITNKLKQLLHFGAKQITNTKESKMDEKELKAFQEQQSALEVEKAELAKERLAFSEKEKKLLEVEQKQADDAIIAKVLSFKEDLVAKKYPVKKMEEAGIFVLAANLLKSQPLTFGETQKPAFDVLQSLVTNFQPVDTEAAGLADKEVHSFSESAKRLHLPANAKVSRKSMERIQFSEQYLEKNRATVPGVNDKQKLAWIMNEILSDRIKVAQ